MNTKNKAIGLLLGILIFLVAIILLPKENIFPFQPKTSSTPEILENGWYRFTDAEAGYYFDYPSDALHISVGKNKGEKYDHVFIQFIGVKGRGSQGMVLIIEPNHKKLSVEDFANVVGFTDINTFFNEHQLKENANLLMAILRSFYRKNMVDYPESASK